MDASTAEVIGGAVAAGGLALRMVLKSLRDRGDRKLLKHVFDQTRSADVLPTLTTLRRPRQLPFTRPRATDSKEQPAPPGQLSSGEEVSR